MIGIWRCVKCDFPVCSPDDDHDCPGSVLRQNESEALLDRLIDARLRRIVERLKVSDDGPLVPEAEVYVRMVVARVIEEELEER